jgi:hypothetical protein
VSGQDFAQEIEPENRKLRQHPALAGDARGEDVVERGDAVGGDDQQPPVDAVYVAHFAAPVEFDTRQIGFEEDWICRVHAAFRFRSGE